MSERHLIILRLTEKLSMEEFRDLLNKAWHYQGNIIDLSEENWNRFLNSVIELLSNKKEEDGRQTW